MINNLVSCGSKWMHPICYFTTITVRIKWLLLMLITNFEIYPVNLKYYTTSQEESPKFLSNSFKTFFVILKTPLCKFWGCLSLESGVMRHVAIIWWKICQLNQQTKKRFLLVSVWQSGAVCSWLSWVFFIGRNSHTVESWGLVWLCNFLRKMYETEVLSKHKTTCTHFLKNTEFSVFRNSTHVVCGVLFYAPSFPLY